MRAKLWCMPAAVGLLLAAGCVSVKAPREIHVGVSRQPESVDSSRIPATASHEEARQELRKAYAYIRWLEQEKAELEKDKVKYKRERDKYKKERNKYKDRLEKYEDD